MLLHLQQETTGEKVANYGQISSNFLICYAMALRTGYWGKRRGHREASKKILALQQVELTS